MEVRKKRNCESRHRTLTGSALFLHDEEEITMRHIISVIVVAALLAATAVDVIAGWTKMDAELGTTTQRQ